jgi:hypothetical protein
MYTTLLVDSFLQNQALFFFKILLDERLIFLENRKIDKMFINAMIL